MTDKEFVDFHQFMVSSMESALIGSALSPLERFDFQHYLSYHKALLNFIKAIGRQPDALEGSFIVQTVFSELDRNSLIRSYKPTTVYFPESSMFCSSDVKFDF